MEYLETDDKYIIDSKEIILDNPSSKLLVPVHYNDVYIGKIELSFQEDENIVGGSIDTSAEGEVMRIKCINFTEPLGRFSTEPVPLGQIQGKVISMQIWSALSNKQGVRRVKYTLFVEK